MDAMTEAAGMGVTVEDDYPELRESVAEVTPAAAAHTTGIATGPFAACGPATTGKSQTACTRTTGSTCR